jgi:putative salt-induced outer membrane protein YdiY
MKAAMIILLTAMTCVSAFSVQVEDPPFEATLGASYNGTGGNTTTHSLGIDGSAVRRFSRVHVDWGGDYLTARSDGDTTAESMGAFGGVKIFVMGSRLYALYRGMWERNTFAGLEHRFSNLGGIGAVIAKSEALTLNAETGVNYIYEKYPETVTPDSESFPSFHAGAEYVINLHDIAEVNAYFGYDMSMKNAEDQLLDAGGGVSVFFVDWLAVSASEAVTWDNTPQSGYEKYDLTSKLGITLRYR